MIYSIHPKTFIMQPCLAGSVMHYHGYRLYGGFQCGYKGVVNDDDELKKNHFYLKKMEDKEWSGFACKKCEGTNRPAEFPKCMMCDTRVRLCLRCIIQQEVTLCEQCAEISAVGIAQSEELQLITDPCCECGVSCFAQDGVNHQRCCNRQYCEKCIVFHRNQVHVPRYICTRCRQGIYNFGKYNKCPEIGCALEYGCSKCFPLKDPKEACCYQHGSDAACSVCKFMYQRSCNIRVHIRKFGRYKDYCGDCGQRIKCFITWALFNHVPPDMINAVLMKFF